MALPQNGTVTPDDVWNVVLSYCDDSFLSVCAARRFGLANKYQLQALNANVKFWNSAFEQSGFIIHTPTGAQTTPRSKYALAARAARNIREPSCYQSTTLDQSSSLHMLPMSRHNNPLVLVNFFAAQISGSYGVNAPQYSKLYDLSEWSKVNSTITMSDPQTASLEWAIVGPNLAAQLENYLGVYLTFQPKQPEEKPGMLHWLLPPYARNQHVRRIIPNRDAALPYVLLQATSVVADNRFDLWLFSTESQQVLSKAPISLHGSSPLYSITFVGEWILVEDGRSGWKGKKTEIYRVDFLQNCDSEFATPHLVVPAKLAKVQIMPCGSRPKLVALADVNGSEKVIVQLDLLSLNNDNLEKELNKAVTARGLRNLSETVSESDASFTVWANLVFIFELHQVHIVDIHTGSPACVLLTGGGPCGVSVIDSTLFVFHTEFGVHAIDLLARRTVDSSSRNLAALGGLGPLPVGVYTVANSSSEGKVCNRISASIGNLFSIIVGNIFRSRSENLIASWHRDKEDPDEGDYASILIIRYQSTLDLPGLPAIPAISKIDEQATASVAASVISAAQFIHNKRSCLQCEPVELPTKRNKNATHSRDRHGGSSHKEVIATVCKFRRVRDSKSGTMTHIPAATIAPISLQTIISSLFTGQ